MNIEQPEYSPAKTYTDPKEAVAQVDLIYRQSVDFLCKAFSKASQVTESRKRYRAFYPEIRIQIDRFAQIDSRLSFGHLTQPGLYGTTLTHPDLFENYLEQQIGLLIRNHNVPVTIGVSDTPIPLHFAMPQGMDGNITQDTVSRVSFRDVFDVPELSNVNDNIVDGQYDRDGEKTFPLAPFTAQRVDYSLARLAHYTATQPKHFQNYVLFTNYQLYVSAFESYAREQLANSESSYTSFVAPGDIEIFKPDAVIAQSAKIPQMPSYHLKRADGNGITLVNIGVGPSNAKTATDHIAVLRPHAWLMVGHCAGLRSGQNLGDFVLAHAYMREDKVLDDDLPVWVPIPALAEVQVALEQAVASVTELEGFELKKIMRTGTVATLDNRNWELRDNSGPVRRLSQSRAVALDMESATVAANGFRFRVPYGTLLCVSDKPLHGELKLPGMATKFYKSQVSRHLMIGLKAMESLQNMPLERLHSRKLRSFDQSAFL